MTNPAMVPAMPEAAPMRAFEFFQSHVRLLPLK